MAQLVFHEFFNMGPFTTCPSMGICAIWLLMTLGITMWWLNHPCEKIWFKLDLFPKLPLQKQIVNIEVEVFTTPRTIYPFLKTDDHLLYTPVFLSNRWLENLPLILMVFTMETFGDFLGSQRGRLMGVHHGHTWLGLIGRFDVRFNGLERSVRRLVRMVGVQQGAPLVIR